MQLFISPTSPYARKARIVLRERGLIGRVEEHFLNPHQDPGELLAANPLGKIPTLERDGGAPLYDSRVVCEWLDAFAGDDGLIPASGAERWAVRHAEAHADGILDLTVAMVMERARAEGEQSPGQMARWREKIERAVASMDEIRGSLPDRFTLGHAALAVTLSYLDLRLTDFDWRAAHPALAEWHADVAERASMRDTAPPAA
ncbi:MAG: glutathione S-transferase N-terminal domain-containing protein [Halofilum sp. (in: g-proteobacteria)]